MKKCLGVCFILVAFLGFANAALAETPRPAVQGLSLEQLHQAVFAPVAQAAEMSDQVSLQGLPGLTPEPLLMSHCIDERPCAYHLCTCNESCPCGSDSLQTKCGPYWTCVCKTC